MNLDYADDAKSSCVLKKHLIFGFKLNINSNLKRIYQKIM